MRLAFLLALGCTLFLSLSAARSALAYDVTTPAARRENVLQYVAGRDDLSQKERSAWDKALRSAFGGQALQDGTDEGVTVAKSVVSGAIFYGVAPGQGARAAWEAYHDTFRWVPPPVAINYQILAFQGRKPKVAARQIAFDFPRYFNEDMAPELASWWDGMLQAKRINPNEVAAVQEALKATREMMRPMLLAKLWQGAQLQARLGAATDAPTAGRIRKALGLIDQDIAQDFRKVGHDPGLLDARAEYYPRYAALAKELGRKPEAPPPAVPPAPPPAAPAPVLAPAPSVAPAPPAKPQDPGQERPAKVPAAAPAPKAPPPVPAEVVAEVQAVQQVQAQEERKLAERRSPPPLPGEGPRPVTVGFGSALNATVDKWVGTPYLFGGLDHHGIDCSAFVREVFRAAASLELPRSSIEQARLGNPVERPQLRAGDLVFFDTLERGRITHVAVYVGEHQIAHASSSKGATRAELETRYFQRAYVGSRRMLQGE